MWFKELCENIAFVGGIVILTLATDLPQWAKIVVGIVLVVVGAIVALH